MVSHILEIVVEKMRQPGCREIRSSGHGGTIEIMASQQQCYLDKIITRPSHPNLSIEGVEDFQAHFLLRHYKQWIVAVGSRIILY